MSDIVIKINGISYSGFKEITVQRSMQAISGGITFIVDDIFYKDASKWDFKLGDEYHIEVNGTLIGNGYIDNIIKEYTKKTHILEVSGRDKTSDLVDCGWDETDNEWIGLTIKSIVTILCEAFDIELEVDDTATTKVLLKIDKFEANEGEKVIDLINRLCFENGIMPLSLGDGRLTLSSVTTNDYADDSLETNINIIAGTTVQSTRDRYSKYKVKGLGLETSNKQLLDYIQPSGETSDAVITRNRPYIVFQDNPTDSGKCKTRAIFEKNIRAGFSSTYSYGVNEWVQSTGKVWSINSLCNIKDDIIKINKIMLISDLIFRYSNEEGYFTNIVLVDKNTYTQNDVEIRSDYFAT